MVRNKSVGDRAFVIINTVLLSLLGIVFFYPMLYQLAISFSNSQAVAAHKVFLWPVDPTLTSYGKVFESGKIVRAYGNTLYYTALGTVLQLIGTTFLAYPLSKRRLVGRRFFSFFF